MLKKTREVHLPRGVLRFFVSLPIGLFLLRLGIVMAFVLCSPPEQGNVEPKLKGKDVRNNQ